MRSTHFHVPELPGGNQKDRETFSRSPFVQSSLDIAVNRQQSSTNLLTSWMKKDIDSVRVVSGFNLNVNTAYMSEAGLGYGLVWEGLTDISEESAITCIPLKPAIHVPLYFV